MIKYFILSDIHAQFKLLNKALINADFNINNKDHILIISGDILDRGKQGNSVIKFLESKISKNRVLGVLGNHDVFLKDILEENFNIDVIKFNIMRNGFGETLKLIKGIDLNELTNESIIKFKNEFIEKYSIFSKWIKSLPIYLEFQNHVIVHAFLNFNLENWRDTSLKFATWSRNYRDRIPFKFGKKLIFGHTPNVHINGSDDIIYDGFKIMIDGGAALNHQINILKLTEETI